MESEDKEHENYQQIYNKIIKKKKLLKLEKRNYFG